MLGVVSFDVTLLELFDACCVVFKDCHRDIYDGVKIVKASNMAQTTLNQKHSQVGSCKERISAWLDEVATKVCLVDLQEIAVSPTVNYQTDKVAKFDLQEIAVSPMVNYQTEYVACLISYILSFSETTKLIR